MQHLCVTLVNSIINLLIQKDLLSLANGFIEFIFLQYHALKLFKRNIVQSYILSTGMKTMSSNSFQGFFLEFGNIYLTHYSKMIITFPSHLYLKILQKANTDFFLGLNTKIESFLIFDSQLLDHLQGSSTSLQIEWVNLLPSGLFVSKELYSFILKGTFPFKATQAEKFLYRKRINHVFVTLYTKNKSFDITEQTISYKLAHSNRVLQYQVSHVLLRRDVGLMTG